MGKTSSYISWELKSNFWTDWYLKYHQCFCVRNERGPQSLWKPIQLHCCCLDCGLHYWTIGTAVFLFNAVTFLTLFKQPSNFILTRVRAHSKFLLEYLESTKTELTFIPTVWIPFLEIGWTVFTFSLAGAKTYHQMLALRFVVRLFEAGYWPALYYILGSWYNKRMLTKLAETSRQENFADHWNDQ